MISLLFFVIACTTLIFFSQEFSNVYKRWMARWWVRLFVPLFLASFFVVTQSYLLLVILYNLQLGLLFLTRSLAGILPFQTGAFAVSQIVVLVIITLPPAAIISFIYHKQKRKPWPYLGIFCAVVWLTTAVLLFESNVF